VRVVGWGELSGGGETVVQSQQGFFFFSFSFFPPFPFTLLLKYRQSQLDVEDLPYVKGVCRLAETELTCLLAASHHLISLTCYGYCCAVVMNETWARSGTERGREGGSAHAREERQIGRYFYVCVSQK
jgi:hypothetical protein